MKEPNRRLLAVIPARGGSKGLPGKNIRPFAGLPLIAHSILFGQMCPEVKRLIVSTDAEEIAAVAEKYHAEVLMRPGELARDETPMWPVLRHALATIETRDKVEFEYLLLLDPTSPAREPSDIARALQCLELNLEADGIIGVSQPDFNPIWHCVVDRGGWMADLMNEASQFERRQQLPTVYRINGSLYIWRAEFLRKEGISWRHDGKHLIYEIPELRAMSIDTGEEFEKAQILVQSGFISFPWLGPDL